MRLTCPGRGGMACNEAGSWCVGCRSAAFLAGCRTTQKVMTGGAMGGVTGFALAGPIGGAAGVAVGAVAAPMMSTD